MLHTLASQLGLIVLVLVCLLALARGGAPERTGALLVALNWVGLLICQSITGQAVPDIPILISDLLLSVGFLLLALRFTSLWLGAGMLFQGAAFAVHVMRMTGPEGWARTYIITVNMLSYCVLLCLAGGAIASWMRRRKAARAAGPVFGDGRTSAAV